jgi:hypothetical protein
MDISIKNKWILEFWKYNRKIVTVSGLVILLVTIMVVLGRPTKVTAGDWDEPSIDVHYNDEWVYAYNLSECSYGVRVDVDIDGTVKSIEKVGGPSYSANIDFSPFDIQPGQIANYTVYCKESSNGSWSHYHTGQHLVRSVRVTCADSDNDTVSGTADPGSELRVLDFQGIVPERWVVADPYGNWLVDYSTDFDLELWHGGVAQQHDSWDSDYDSTVVDWQVYNNPCFNTHVNGDGFHLYNWPPFANLTLTIDDPATAINPDFETDFSADPDGEPFNIDISGQFDVKAGHIVTVKGWCNPKIHEVTGVEVECVNVNQDKIYGVAPPGSEVETIEHFGLVPSQKATADSDGIWVTDYGLITFDLQSDHHGEAVQYDDDGDTTQFAWSALPDLQCEKTKNNINNARQRHDMAYVLRIMMYNLEDCFTSMCSSEIQELVEEAACYINQEKINDAKMRDDYKAILESMQFTQTGTLSEQCAAQQWEQGMEAITTIAVSLFDDAYENCDIKTILEMMQLAMSGFINSPQLEYIIDNGTYALDVKCSGQTTNSLTITAASPVDLLVTAPDYKRIGMTPEGVIVKEIPGATYSGPDAVLEQITIPNPMQGDYKIELLATGDGEYHLSVIESGENDKIHIEQSSGTVNEGEVVQEETTVALDVEIDIKPDDEPNLINMKKKGAIPVAMLGSSDFDVTTINPVTLVLVGVACKHDLTNPVNYNEHLKDANDDGIIDLMTHFEVDKMNLEKGAHELTLNCSTFDGKLLRGKDEVICK